MDLWGGYRDPHKTLPWQEDTMVFVFSSTKGLAGLTMALAHSRGLFEYDAPIASYWPELLLAHVFTRISVLGLLRTCHSLTLKSSVKGRCCCA